MIAADSAAVALARQNAGAIIAACGVLAGSLLTFSFAVLNAWLSHRRERDARREQWARDDLLRRRADAEEAQRALLDAANQALGLGGSLLDEPTEEMTLSRQNSIVSATLTPLLTAATRVELSSSTHAASAGYALFNAIHRSVVADITRPDGAGVRAERAAADLAAGDALKAFVNAVRMERGLAPQEMSPAKATSERQQ